MISIEELKKRCFKEYYDPRFKEYYKNAPALWYAFRVTHFFSIRIVRLLLPTSVRPNQITLLALVLGFCSTILFSTGSKTGFLAGAFFLELYYIFDSVDGQLARARGMSSLSGCYFDIMAGYIVQASVFVGVAFGLSKHFADGYLILLAGFLASIAIIMLSFTEILKERIIFQQRLRQGAAFAQNENKEEQPLKKAHGIKLLFSILHRSSTYPVIMNVITINAFINLFLDRPFLLRWSLFYFSICGTAVWSMRLAHNIITRRIELETKPF